MEETFAKRFSIFCDFEGRVTEIIEDEHNFLSSSLIGNMLFSVVVPGDLDKILNFFLELKGKHNAIGWEINISVPVGAATFTFFGGIFDGRIGIAAATTKNGAQLLFDELTRMNNEQTNIIRALTKENGKRQVQPEEPPVAYYEELSRLNNDLVNMQRELAKKNHELVELNRLKNQFLGIAAHDLRSPLAVIMGYSGFLLEEVEEILSEDQNEMLTSIMESSEFMLRLLNELLDISAIESGNLNINLVQADLGIVVRKNVELNNVIANKKNISIYFNQPEALPEILFDIGKIEQVLNNLISNAVKFSKPGSIVNVSVSKSDSDLTVAVADQGPGIPESEREKLFIPFQMTSVKSTGGEKSTGLGLSIVRNLILGHQGKIWVESELSIGSTFYFSLPLLKKGINITHAVALNEKNLINKLKILVVEDDDISRRLISIGIQKFAKEIIFVKSGKDAVETCRNNPDCHLILMDIKLPEIDGFEATRLIRDFNKEVVIIAQTAMSNSGDREKSLEAGCNDYIPKPIKKHVLLDLLLKYFS